MILKTSLINTKKLIIASLFAFMLLPMMAFASSEYKGTETVNINKANAATLAAYLKGIGPNKAEAIVKYRRSNGNFKSTSDLKNVPGIGDKTFKDLKSKVSTSRGKSVAPKGYKLGESSGKTSTTKKKKVTSSKSKSKSTSSKDKTLKTKATDKKKTTSTKKKKSDAKDTATKDKSKKKPKKVKKTTKKTTSTKKTSKKKPVKKKIIKKKTK